MSTSDNPRDRRNFIKICGSMMAAAATGSMGPLAHASTEQRYERVQLTLNKEPFSASSLPVGKTYIFNYPYITTPCMIMNIGKRAGTPVELKTESGSQYVWQGGIGRDKSVVAYSAICAHKMTYTAKAASFINYRHSKVVYFDDEHRRKEKTQIIYCCSERSIYDPSLGAMVIGGPAPQPLAAISLEEDEAGGSTFAVGTAGGEMFSKFLKEFEFRLQLDFKITNVGQLASGNVEIVPVEEYSDTLVYC